MISGSKEFDFNFSKNVSIVYQNVKDSPKRNEEGLSLLENYIDDIFSSFSIEELENVIFRIENDLGIDILTHFDVDLDSEDTDKTLIYLSPVSFAFGASSDYFVNDDYLLYQAYIKRGIIQLLEVYGYDENKAHEVARELISFYGDITYKRGVFMFIVFIRTAILYTIVVIVMRLMGKRQIGELQPYEFVITIMISDLASLPMQDTRFPLLLLVQYLITKGI